MQISNTREKTQNLKDCGCLDKSFQKFLYEYSHQIYGFIDDYLTGRKRQPGVSFFSAKIPRGKCALLQEKTQGEN